MANALSSRKHQVTNLDQVRADQQSRRLAKREHRWEWRLALAKVDLPASAYRVGLALCEKYLNAQTGDAFPTCETLSKLTGLSERTLRDGVTALVKAGLLRVRKTRFSGPNSYRLAIPATLQSGENSPHRAIQSGDSPQPIRRISAAQSGENSPPNLTTYPEYLEPEYQEGSMDEERNLPEMTERDSPQKESEQGTQSQELVELLALIECDPGEGCLVRRMNYDEGQRTIVGNVACRLLGYGDGFTMLDGDYADREILARLPDPVLRALVKAARAGRLSEATLAAVLARLEVPRAARAA